MVPLKGVQEAHLRMAHSGINQLVYMRHGKKVFEASFIQICEVHTHLSFPILLLYYYSIG